MIRTIYYIILLYFLSGGVGFYFINRKKDLQTAWESYRKFIVYFLIINIVFFSIIIDPVVFRHLAAGIICMGSFELFRLFRLGGYKQKSFFVFSLFVFILLSSGFILFSGLKKELILFSFLILSIFDSFSQITGQLWGKTKLFSNISPEKTVGGFVGGAAVAAGSSLFLSGLYEGDALQSLFMSIGVVVFAFSGDLAASLYKRKYNVKDFSNLIPGHGGFLDRFDSLIAGGAWTALWVYVF
ncbi:MAG: phosphatidate cytidylyltransferase [Mangrovibacterium sp.]|jgi:phosphatidate cytidylyltransferase